VADPPIPSPEASSARSLCGAPMHENTNYAKALTNWRRRRALTSGSMVQAASSPQGEPKRTREVASVATQNSITPSKASTEADTLVGAQACYGGVLWGRAVGACCGLDRLLEGRASKP
jgi:hypothetical protein